MKQFTLKATELIDVANKISGHFKFDPTLSFRHVSEKKYAKALGRAEDPLIISESIFANYIHVDEDVIVYFKKNSWEELPSSVKSAIFSHRYFKEHDIVKKSTL